MSTRIRISTGILTAAVSVFALQATTSPDRTRRPSRRRTGGRRRDAPRRSRAEATAKLASHTRRRAPSDGQPDLQGFWTNATLTPLQRPAGRHDRIRDPRGVREARRAAGRPPTRSRPSRAPRPTSTTTSRSSRSTRRSRRSRENYRTSQIIDPPDGRMPPQTPEAQKRIAAAAAARKQQGAQTDRVQNMSQRHALHHLRRRGTAADGRRLQRQLSDRAVEGHGDDPHRDDPRRAHHPARQPSGAAGRLTQLDGRLARPVGRRHPRRRNDELQRQAAVPAGIDRNMKVTERFTRESARIRSPTGSPSKTRRHGRVRGRRKQILRDDRRTDLRARLPRGQLRRRQHAGRRPARRKAAAEEAAKKGTK